MFGLPLIPAPWSWIARIASVALVAVSLIGYGWTLGAGHVQDQVDKERSEQTVAMANAHAKQALRVAAVVQKQTAISEDSDNAYQTARSALAALSARSVQHRTAAGDRATLPTASAPAGQPDAAPADSGSGPGVPAPDPECQGLRADAALTTLQLLHLQVWIRNQATESEIRAQAADSEQSPNLPH